MRHYRAKAIPGVVLVHVSINAGARARIGDVAARIVALEVIRDELDQALKADPHGIRTYHVALSAEKSQSIADSVA